MPEPMSKGHRLLLRYIAALIILIGHVAISKLLSWGLGTDFYDMLLVTFIFLYIVREIKVEDTK